MKNKLINFAAGCLVVSMMLCLLSSCSLLGGGENPPVGDNNPSGGQTSDETNNKPSTPDKGEEEEVLSDKGIFFSSAAADGGDGSLENPYNSLDIIPTLTLEPGSHIYLEKGSVFYGKLLIPNVSGTEEEPIVVTSYGKGA